MNKTNLICPVCGNNLIYIKGDSFSEFRNKENGFLLFCNMGKETCGKEVFGHVMREKDLNEAYDFICSKFKNSPYHPSKIKKQKVFEKGSLEEILSQ